MADARFLENVLNSIKDPVLVADTEHRVVYMNTAAVAHYTGGEKLVGTSLFDCHNENSGRIMREVLAALATGEEERCIHDGEKHRIFMRAVRDADGKLVGYFERYEPPATRAEAGAQAQDSVHKEG